MALTQIISSDHTAMYQYWRASFRAAVTAAFTGVTLLLSGCGSDTQESPTNAKTAVSSIAALQSGASWAGGQEYVDAGVLTPLTAGFSDGRIVQHIQWRQVSGPSAHIVDSSNRETLVLLPFVASQTELLFEAALTDAQGNVQRVQQSVMVMPLAPAITVVDPWLRSASSDVALRANFDHTTFALFDAGELAVGSDQQVAVDIVWVTPQDQLLNLFSEPPTQVVFDASRQGRLPLLLRRAPLDLGASNAPGQGSNQPPNESNPTSITTQSLQFDIVLPNGQRSPVTLLVAFAQASAASSLGGAGSSVSSADTITPSSAQVPSSQASAPALSSFSSAASQSAASSEPADAVLAQAINAICESVDMPAMDQSDIAHVANPYVGAVGYIDGDFVANVEASQNKVIDDTALVAAMEMVKQQPTGVWLDSRAKVCGSPADGSQNFVQHLKAAQAQSVEAGKPVVMTAVIYNLPGRDCVRQARLGELPASEEGMAQYQQFINQIADLSSLFPSVRIAAILEPDAFATTVSTGGTIRTLCRSTDAQSWYSQGLRFALNRFSEQQQIYSYLDYGDPSWPGSYSGEVALAEFWQSSLLENGESPIDGISLNVAGYIPMDEPFMLPQIEGNDQSYSFEKGLLDVNSYISYLANYLEQAVGHKLPMLVDTARNGWGGEARRRTAGVGESFRVDRRNGRDSWCNIDGSGLGEFPAVAEQVNYVWALAPGISQGNSTRGCDPSIDYYRFMPIDNPLPAGEWFHDYFTQLVTNANPALAGPANVVQPLPLEIKVQPLVIPVLSKADVAVTATLPEGVAFSALSINYSGQTIALAEPWQGLNSVQITADIIPSSYFFDELRFNARGDNGENYAAVIPLTDRQPFDGSPATDVVLDGLGGFADFYRPYQAELADYTYSNNGYAGDDFIVGGFGGAALSGGDGDDYLQAGDIDGGRGDDTLVFWHSPNASYAYGGDGNDVYHVTDGSVVILTDTAGDTDIVYNIRPLGEGQRYIIDVATNDRFLPDAYTENDLMIMVVNADDDYVRRLFLHDFFAEVPHFAAVHLADGQVITPETARAMIWPEQSSSSAVSP